MKARRGGVPITRSRQSIKPITPKSSINLEKQYATVYDKLKKEKDEYDRSVYNYQQDGAYGYELGPKPAYLVYLNRKLSKIRQKIDALKPKPPRIEYDLDLVTKALGDL